LAEDLSGLNSLSLLLFGWPDEDIGKIADLISKCIYAQFWFFVFIFLNNAVKAIVIIYLGVIFGIILYIFCCSTGWLWVMCSQKL